MVILKLKIKNFTVIKVLFLGHFENALVKISFGEKNYKYSIGYLHDDYEIKPLHMMLSKTKVYIKRCNGETKWMYFLIENDDLL